MKPSARIAAAITILDQILAGQPAEQALTHWARKNRYAGSSDRAAVRDHVFDALRRMRSYAAAGGAETGRGIMLGSVRQSGADPATVFTGDRHAPDCLTPLEAAYTPDALTESQALDVPDWLEMPLRDSLGDAFVPTMRILQERAPVHLRVNVAKSTRAAAQAILANDDIETTPVALAETALQVVKNSRRVAASRAYQEGVVELQDAASQAVMLALAPLPAGTRILDFCAGGGGKSLALAALSPEAHITAHDASVRRMADLPQRAKRAGARVNTATDPHLLQAASFDLVLCDVPCSGSGSWRRNPAGKWTLSPEKLADLQLLQSQILTTASGYVAPHGRLAYVTCSLLQSENEAQIDRFREQSPGWQLIKDKRYLPTEGGDGFYVAELTREG
ncbi:MAG: RsmB/NOP family class I SAM-dependent RNA methyltransferase, partial [Pseudomonadota bacterium]